MSPKPEAEVHWHEGMFLRPHHLQAFAAQVRSALADTTLSLGAFRYGVRRLTVDETRLQAGQLVLQDVDLVMPDGLRVSVPDNARVESVEFGEAFEESRGRLEVFLGVPSVPVGVGAIADEQNRRGRYLVDEVMRPDENTGRSEQSILCRSLNLRLFLSGEDRSGYSTMKVAEIVRKGELDPEPVLDAVYVPPLLEVSGHAGLRRRLGEICDSLRSTNEALGKALSSKEMALTIESGTDPTNLFKLHTTNAHVPVVEQNCLSPGVHPFDAYRSLCALAGALALFSESRSCPQLPLYDHEDIGGRFETIIRLIKTHLHHTSKRTWDRVTFQRNSDNPYRYDCSLKDDWVAGGLELYLGVETALESARVEQLVTAQMKIAAPSDLNNILGAVVRGVAVVPQARTPAALPELTNVHYFQLDAKKTDALRWQPVVADKAICIVGNASEDPGIQFHVYAARKG